MWDSIGDTLSNSLQRLQNRAARIITGAPYSKPSGEILEKLGWAQLNSMRQFHKAIMFPDSVERLLVAVCFLCFCNTVKFIVMQIELLVVVFMALLLTTENSGLRDVKITFQQDFIKLMIMSRSDLH